MRRFLPSIFALFILTLVVDTSYAGVCQAQCRETRDDCLSDCLTTGGYFACIMCHKDYELCLDDCPSQCVVPLDGLVAWWPFDEVHAHSADRAPEPGRNDAYHVNNPSYGVQGRVDQAIRFDGFNEYLRVLDQDPAGGAGPDSVDFGTGSFSIVSWIKTDSGGFVVQKEAPATSAAPFRVGWNVLVTQHFGTVAVFLHDGYDWSSVSSTESIHDGEWHMIAAVVDRNHLEGIKLYIDGRRVDGTTSPPLATVGSVSNASDLLIGAGEWPFGQPFAGTLDDLQLYDRALSTTEVMTLFHSADAGICGCDLYPPYC